MVALATFADSDAGRAYAAIQSRYGVDPAAGIRDDVVAYNLRAALLYIENRDAAAAEAEAEPGTGAKPYRDFKSWVEASA